MTEVASVGFSRYHTRIIALAIHNAKPSTKDRGLMDAWVNMAAEIGNAIREQGGQFNMQNWLDLCWYGAK